MARRKKYVPRELPARIQGAEQCQPYGNAQICVTAGKFGWQAWLTSMSGQKVAPISIGRARSTQDAMRAAVLNAQRIRAGRRNPNRR